MAKLVMFRMLLVVLAVLVLGASFASAEPTSATISLGRDPEPPMAVLDPGGTVTIFWTIQHSTTPSHVYFKLEDPTRTIIYDQQTYPGSTGIAITRTWTVPVGAPEGKYWIRVEYWSYEAGNEANAEVTFYVCDETGDVCAQKWQDLDCNNILSGPDAPVANWWICLHTPFGDDFCKATDANGQVCWPVLPCGNYTISEVVRDGWEACYPTSYDFSLEGGSQSFIFLNKLQGASSTESSTWGQIKGLYR